ncbi:MAG: hypothetical protein AB1720_09570 [Pseudomonadota bacterium]
MKRIIYLAVILAAIGVAPAQAANGIDEDKVTYRDWGETKPNVVTFISDKMPRVFRPYIRSFNVSWLDMRVAQVRSMQSYVCDIVNRTLVDKCKGAETPALLIREAFLGTAEEFKQHPNSGVKSGKHAIGIDQLADLPPGAKRVIQVAVMEVNEIRTVISVSYDDISDDDLRTIALEDGIFRVLRWRSN